MADHASDYRHGDMDVQEHLVTYQAFGRMYKWGALIAASVILFFSTWLCAHAGFLQAAILTIIVLALGIFALTRKKPDTAETELE
jgi:hypothetical protein